MFRYMTANARAIGLLMVLLALVGCSTAQPRNINNVCAIFDEYHDWYSAAKDVKKRYRVPIAVSMAFIHQESKFIADNRPPRRWILGIIPWTRPSTAYGYAQALDSTWEAYLADTGQWFASRDDFEDAVDFVGWYNAATIRRARVKPHDAYRLYLAYHEGVGGFMRGSFSRKPWLKKVARKVSGRAKRYQSQLVRCRSELDRIWW